MGKSLKISKNFMKTCLRYFNVESSNWDPTGSTNYITAKLTELTGWVLALQATVGRVWRVAHGQRECQRRSSDQNGRAATQSWRGWLRRQRLMVPRGHAAHQLFADGVQSAVEAEQVHLGLLLVKLALAARHELHRWSGPLVSWERGFGIGFGFARANHLEFTEGLSSHLYESRNWIVNFVELHWLCI